MAEELLTLRILGEELCADCGQWVHPGLSETDGPAGLCLACALERRCRGLAEMERQAAQAHTRGPAYHAHRGAAGAYEQVLQLIAEERARQGERVAETQECAGDIDLTPVERRADAAIRLAEKALIAAKRFIRNGVAYGFIYMPDGDDPAWLTEPMIDRALAAIARVKAGGRDGTRGI